MRMQVPKRLVLPILLRTMQVPKQEGGGCRYMYSVHDTVGNFSLYKKMQVIVLYRKLKYLIYKRCLRYLGCTEGCRYLFNVQKAAGNCVQEAAGNCKVSRWLQVTVKCKGG